MSPIVTKLRSRKERVYQIVVIAFGILLWVLILLGVVAGLKNPKSTHVVELYIFYAAAFWIFILVSAAAYRATAFGNMLLLGPQQFPDLHQAVVIGSQEIGLAEPPKTFIYNSNGLLNAFARRLLGGRYVFLTSALLETETDAQVRFVIGHEIGHHAAGHLSPWLNFLKLPSHMVPFLGPAYSRSRETTCDNIGAYLSRDFDASRSSLQMLGCGCRRLNQTMNCEAFMAQEAMVPPIFGFITEIFRSHPRLTRRVAAIQEAITQRRV